jgi:cytochrome c2
MPEMAPKPPPAKNRFPLVFLIALLMASPPSPHMQGYFQSCGGSAFTRTFVAQPREEPEREQRQSSPRNQKKPVFASAMEVSLLHRVLPSLYAQAGSPGEASAIRGEQIFISLCISCHSIGGGATVGPDLKDITARRTREWNINFIVDPQQVVSEGSPLATQLAREYDMVMPDLGLNREQALDVLAYLESPQTGAGAPSSILLLSLGPPASVEKVEQFSPQANDGLMYFTGSKDFLNDGAMCKICHNLDLPGLPYERTPGPSLAGVYARFGEQRLHSSLHLMQFPTMNPIYDKRPLTEEEITSLVAMFKEAGNKKPSPVTLLLGIPMAGGGVVLALIGLWIVRFRRLKKVRSELARKAREATGMG